jgi:hypothetical protein
MSTAIIAQQYDYLPEEKKSLLGRDIGSRLRLLLVAKTPEKKRYEELEKLTTISSATWRTWWRRSTYPSGAMIEAAAKVWPEHAFWLASGLTDVEAGHNLPYPPPSLIKPYIDVYPESPFSANNADTPSWAVFSEHPSRGMKIEYGEENGEVTIKKIKLAGQFTWPEEEQEILDATSEYLRMSKEMQDEYWKEKSNRGNAAPAKLQILESGRLKARALRWAAIQRKLRKK